MPREEEIRDNDEAFHRRMEEAEDQALFWDQEDDIDDIPMPIQENAMRAGGRRLGRRIIDNAIREFKQSESKKPLTVRLAETSKEVNYDDAVSTPLGWYLKTDPRLVIDCMSGNQIIYDVKFNNVKCNYYWYWFGIDSYGNFADKRVSLYAEHHDIVYNKTIIIHNSNGKYVISNTLLDNNTFNEY